MAQRVKLCFPVTRKAYNGFNLLVGDLRARSLAYITNRGKAEALKRPQELPPGSYGISNGVLGDNWVKVQTASQPISGANQQHICTMADFKTVIS
jgi:uncharacterized protein with NRDE domain